MLKTRCKVRLWHRNGDWHQNAFNTNCNISWYFKPLENWTSGWSREEPGGSTPYLTFSLRPPPPPPLFPSYSLRPSPYPPPSSSLRWSMDSLLWNSGDLELQLFFPYNFQSNPSPLTSDCVYKNRRGLFSVNLTYPVILDRNNELPATQNGCLHHEQGQCQTVIYQRFPFLCLLRLQM